MNWVGCCLAGTGTVLTGPLTPAHTAVRRHNGSQPASHQPHRHHLVQNPLARRAAVDPQALTHLPHFPQALPVCPPWNSHCKISICKSEHVTPHSKPLRASHREKKTQGPPRTTWPRVMGPLPASILLSLNTGLLSVPKCPSRVASQGPSTCRSWIPALPWLASSLHSGICSHVGSPQRGLS